MKISLGCDHGGYALKEHIKAYLESKGHEVVDCGTYSTDSCDYPIFGEAAARKVQSGECERGIVICTTGIGISIAANKVRGIRCALCSEPLSAEMTRRHNNANMLAMGAGMIGKIWPSASLRSSSPPNLRAAATSAASVCWTPSRAETGKFDENQQEFTNFC